MSDVSEPDPASDQVELRLACLRLRRRIEHIGDEVVRQIMGLDDRPWTKDVRFRITMLMGRVLPAEVAATWPVVNAARHAYARLSDVLHGRLAWNRIPATDMAMWLAAVDDLTKLAEKLGVIDGNHATMADTTQPEQ